MFEDGILTPSGVHLYSSIAHNIAGVDVTDSADPQVKDLLRKYSERGRELFSENSEDSLSWSLFHALTKLPTKDWLVDFFRVAVNDGFAKRCAPHVHLADVRFWTPYPAPPIYRDWLLSKILREGEDSIKHLERFEDRVRAKKRLALVLDGDKSEIERPTEVDIRITLGKELLVFVEAKLTSDLGSHGTFAPTRNQLVRNLEQLAHYAQDGGYKDWRFILLTMDRLPDKLYTKMMKRYRCSDMRMLRRWDESGNVETLREDLPHRSGESDEYFRTSISKKMGWLLWNDAWKLLANYCHQR